MRRAHLCRDTLLVGNCHQISCISDGSHCSLAHPHWESCETPQVNWLWSEAPFYSGGWEKEGFIISGYAFLPNRNLIYTDPLQILAQEGFPHCEGPGARQAQSCSRSSSDTPCKRRLSLTHGTCSSSQTSPGLFPSKEFLFTLLLLPLIKVYTEPEVSLMGLTCCCMVAAQMVCPVAQPGAMMSFKTRPHMSQEWDFCREGPHLGALICDTLTETPCSEHGASSSTPCQQSGGR